MTTLETLKALQTNEVNTNFANGELYNDLQDMIYKIENNIYEGVETVIGETYGAKEMKK